MNQYNPELLKVILAALYLRGAPRKKHCLARYRHEIFNLIENSGDQLESIQNHLKNHGYFTEAKTLQDEELIKWVQMQIERNYVLTRQCRSYPKQWKTALGKLAPAALWKLGDIPEEPFLSIVGSRQISSENRAFIESIVRFALREGFAICSGGALGADDCAAHAVCRFAKDPDNAPLLEILPHGLNKLNRDWGGFKLSACEPDATFQTKYAMERNGLIFAASKVTVVVQPKYQEGGSWYGAVQSLEKKLSTVAVHDEKETEATKALVSMGAYFIDSFKELMNLYHIEPTEKQIAFELS